MNVENIKQVIAAIRAEDAMFDMSDYVFRKYIDEGENICYTPACICGWANALASDDRTFWALRNEDHAAAWLGLNHADAFDLFHALKTDDYDQIVGEVYLVDISKQEAIITLENLIETGNVDWTHCEKYRERSVL